MYKLTGDFDYLFVNRKEPCFSRFAAIGQVIDLRVEETDINSDTNVIEHREQFFEIKFR